MRNNFLMSSIIITIFVIMSGFTTGVDQSESILRDSKKKLESLQDFSANFQYSIENPSLKPIVQSGSIKYKGGKYLIKLEDQEIYCNGKVMWIHLPEDNEVQKMDYSEEDGMNIEAIFNIYESSSRSRYEGSETVHGVLAHKIFLAIQDDNLDYNRAYVWISQKSNILEKVQLIDRRQTQTTYEFSNIETNTGLDDSVFNFDEDGFEGDIYDDSTN